MDDKREFERYRAKKGAFAVLRNDYRNLGEIVDISIAGLAFHYISAKGKLNGSSELDILLDRKGFHSIMIPFRTISDFELDYEIPAELVKIRRRGVQFTDLKHNQLLQLKNFIKIYTSQKS
ncbi:PilZ domain-containing protein [Thermodesulfobacteriota bacterium]